MIGMVEVETEEGEWKRGRRDSNVEGEEEGEEEGWEGNTDE